jgi:kumamolisin
MAEAAPRPQSSLSVAPLSHHSVHRAALPGTALPQVRQSTKVGAPAATKRINAVVFLRPKNPWLLKRVATRTSGRAAYPSSVLQELFLPSAAQVAKVEGYLRSQGLTVTGTHSFSINTTGSVAANQRAFGVSIGLYQGAHGRTFRAPSGAVKLPASVASAVQAVGGLDTALRLHRQTGETSAPSISPAPGCGAQDVKNADPRVMLPADLASAGGYNIGAVGTTGAGQTIGLVEFSGYKISDITTARDCFGLSSSPATIPVPVNGGSPDRSGAAEVELDIQVAQETAPGAQIRVYMAPNDVTYFPAMIDQMVHDGVNIGSDSWGVCEPMLPPSIVKAENTSLQWAAAHGLSFYVASGDHGSSGCGFNALAVDDPASQPFATSVGGTTLKTTGASPNESAWTGGGGGLSQFWVKPSWQVSGHTLPVSWTSCDYPRRQCRETPDIALDANPTTGYIIYCTAGINNCSGAEGWYSIGGTSGAAPLMAGITAVANEYSLGHGGGDLGFASPFLYSPAANSVFNDVTTGNNNIYGGADYPALKGYDMATGLGSVNADNLATALAGYTPSTPKPDHATLKATSPAAGTEIRYGQSVTFRGTLTDSTTHQGVANAPVWIQTSVGWGRAVTNSTGQWAFKLRLALVQNMVWRLVYTGSDALTPTATSSAHLYVQPHLSAAVNLPRSRGHYDAKVGQRFTFQGVSSPNMRSARVTMQFRKGRSAWTSLATVTVGRHGKYGIRLRDNHRETILIRWEYKGGKTYRWLSTVSKALVVKVS